jgi:hypothetical protein
MPSLIINPAMASPQTQDKIVVVPDPAELELAKIPTSAVTKTMKESDPFLIAFELPYDAENPLEWPTNRKWMVTDVMSATSFNRIMVSTIMAPALSTIASELNMSPTESAMSLSIYLLATAFGPLFIGPLSEIYGRKAILHTSNVWFVIWNVVCGFATVPPKGPLLHLVSWLALVLALYMRFAVEF